MSKKELKRGRAYIGTQLADLITATDGDIVDPQPDEEEDEEENEKEQDDNKKEDDENSDDDAMFRTTLTQSFGLFKLFDKHKIPTSLRISLCRNYANYLAQIEKIEDHLQKKQKK